jgi:hypothetical protein
MKHSAAAAKITPAPGRSWWQDEVRALLANAASLNATARGMVRAVLSSLADDPASDDAERRDIALLLSALDQPSSLSEAA